MIRWIVAAALGSLAVSALMAWLLWRMNAPMRERGSNRGGEGKD